MKKTTLIWYRAGVVTALLLLVGVPRPAKAQTDPTVGGPAPTAVPLDGGATLLLAGGVAYGLKKLRQRRQR